MIAKLFKFKATKTNFFLHTFNMTHSFSKPNFNCSNESIKIEPVIIYTNCEIEKDKIFSTVRTNIGKAVIYRLINNINKKTYVGSSVNFTKR